MFLTFVTMRSVIVQGLRMGQILLIFAALLCVETTIAASLPVSNSQCQFEAAAAKEAGKAVGNLAVKLYGKIAKLNENVIFSPVSIALGLALVEGGTAGRTRNEIRRLLGPAYSNRTDPSEVYQSLQHQLHISGSDRFTSIENPRLSIANGFFYAEDLYPKKKYVNKVQQCFETQLAREPFTANPELARGRINRWVSNATAKKIPELLKSGTIDSTTRAVLANAIYMKAAWVDRFRHSEDLPFYRPGKSDKAQTVRFMLKEQYYGYASKDNYHAVELPYEQAPLSMYVILPKQRDGIATVEQSLKGDRLVSLFGEIYGRRVLLKLPKFTIRQSVDLKAVLKQLGLGRVFSDLADFSRMAAEPLKVSKAVHEAYIKVNEDGTEAAAASAFAIGMGAAPGPPDPAIEFTADHPFIFAVVHKPTSAIVFMGKVTSVQE